MASGRAVSGCDCARRSEASLKRVVVGRSGEDFTWFDVPWRMESEGLDRCFVFVFAMFEMCVEDAVTKGALSEAAVVGCGLHVRSN